MARSNAERQAAKRERDALGLLYCPAWIPGEAFEPYLNAGAISDEETDDPEARARFVRLVFEAAAKVTALRLSGTDSANLPLKIGGFAE